MVELYPREGVSLFVAGHTPEWGMYEFRCNGKLYEGVRQVDTLEGVGIIYARDAHGNWPVFSPAGKPLLYTVTGEWTASIPCPPDSEFTDPDAYVRKKRARARKKEAANVG